MYVHKMRMYMYVHRSGLLSFFSTIASNFFEQRVVEYSQRNKII